MTDALMGTIVGGCIATGEIVLTQVSTITIELVRRKLDRRDKLKEQQREALKTALEWIAPIERFLMGPNWDSQDKMVREMAKLDPPAHLRTLLPSEAYDIGMRIQANADILAASREMIKEEEASCTELRDRVARENKASKQELETLSRRALRVEAMRNESLDMHDKIRADVKRLHDLLTAAYIRTY